MNIRPPTVELLEERCVPVTWGNAWPDAMNLTLSFAADGTIVGDRVSSLQSVLDTQAAREAWQTEVLRAFQTWAVNANINIGLTADGGLAFGSGGRVQGDDRFGDIRIAGYNIGPDVLAIATPFEATAGTWAGDVKLNTTAGWGIGGQGAIDVFSALLHEAGHVFGLDHSLDPASPLFATYQGIRTGLTADDIANLQALYGSREADRHEGSAGNESLSSATRLHLLTDPDGALGVAADGDLRNLNDKDFFHFQTPLNLGPMVINLKTAGISLLNARVTVYDSSGRVVASAGADDPLANDLSLRINSPRLLSTYYVKVESNTADVFGVGSYRLEVKALPLVGTVTSTLSSTVSTVTKLLNDDLHTDDTFLTAQLLPQLTTRVGSRFDYGFSGSIRDSWDVDLYKVRAPQGVAGTETVMTAMVWGLENNGLLPRVSVYNSQQQLVNADVLVNADGNFIIQVRNAVAGADYFVKVQAADSAGPNNTGNYFLGVDFSSQAVQLNTFTTGTLDANKAATGGLLTVGQSEMVHLVLSAEGAAASVRLTVSDMRGNAIATVTAVSGRDPVSLTQGLTAGQYLIRFEAFTADGSPLPGQVRYTLKGSRLSDPIGPSNADATAAPSESPPPPSSTTYEQPMSPTTSEPPSDASAPPPSSSQPPPPARPEGMTDEEYQYYCCYYYQCYYEEQNQTSTGQESPSYTAS